MRDKRRYLHYIHGICIKKFDPNDEQLRDVMYKGRYDYDENYIYKKYSEKYPEILTIDQFEREIKLNELFDEKTYINSYPTNLG